MSLEENLHELHKVRYAGMLWTDGGQTRMTTDLA